MKQYFQCHLVQGNTHVTAWVEARAAKVGATVEVLPDKTLWTVDQVFSNGLTEDMLREHQRLNRKSLPSVEAMT